VKAWTARAVPYAAVTPAAKSAHGLRLRVANLEAALERAERERDHFRDAWAEAQVRLDCGADATEAVREERAAVVAWLRSQVSQAAGPGDLDLDWAADCIEAGRHRVQP
jgi:hypothetical protein